MHVVTSATATATARQSVSERMAELRAEGSVAFIPFITAGDPDLATTAEALRRLDAAGADVIELGVPYSDPLADGPVIQAASTRALEAATTLDGVLAMVAEVSPTLRAPLLMFTYYNPIMARGADNFCRQAKEAGVSGLLVPDLPMEETGLIRAAAEAAGLQLTLLATPTTPEPRMKAIAHLSEGFVYLVSVAGVTGTRVKTESRVEGLIQMLKGQTDKPVCVGFGVSGPEQASQLAAWGAEGIIVGSALVRALGEAATPEEGLDAMERLARSIRESIPRK